MVTCSTVIFNTVKCLTQPHVNHMFITVTCSTYTLVQLSQRFNSQSCSFDGNKKIFQNIDGIPKFLDSLDIENVHVKCCKFLMGVNKRAVNLAVKGELGHFPVGISCMLQAFKYWYHIQSSSNILLQ